jgi:hypothetical protein
MNAYSGQKFPGADIRPVQTAKSRPEAPMGGPVVAKYQSLVPAVH